MFELPLNTILKCKDCLVSWCIYVYSNYLTNSRVSEVLD